MSNPIQDGGFSKTRVEALTDGVFAIAMTLLIFGIKVPETAQGPSASLTHELLQLWPRFLSYAISFVILGIYWVGHHNQFHYVHRTDRVLLWINIFFLMCVTFIPFSTALLGQYPNDRTALMVYGLNLVMVGIFLYAHWWYATHRHRLVHSDIHPELVRLAKQRILMGPAGFLLAIGLSFVSTRLSLALYALVPVFYLLPGRIDRHWHRSPAEDSRGRERSLPRSENPPAS